MWTISLAVREIYPDQQNVIRRILKYYREANKRGVEVRCRRSTAGRLATSEEWGENAQLHLDEADRLWSAAELYRGAHRLRSSVASSSMSSMSSNASSWVMPSIPNADATQ